MFVADPYGFDVAQPVELVEDRVALVTPQLEDRSIFVARMTAAVEALLANSDVTEVVLVGYSFGGTGAVEIIGNAPDAMIGEGVCDERKIGVAVLFLA